MSRAAAATPRKTADAPPALRLGGLERLVGYHLRRAQVAVFQDFSATVGDGDITPGQLGVLAIIDANPGLSQTRLGAALGIDRSTIVGVLDRLETRGLVVRETVPRDRRSHALTLSSAGTALLRRLETEVEAHERRVSRRLSAAEREQLMTLLARIADPG